MPSSSVITLSHGILEAFYAHFAAFFDVLPIELVVLPTLERHVGQQIGRGGLARRGIQIESCHQRHVDDASAQIGLGHGQLLPGQRAQGVVLVAAANGDADDGHARLARLVDQAVGVTAAEQLTEQHKDIAFAKNIGLWNIT